MTNEAPRDRDTTPSFPSTTEGGIDVWIRVLRDETRLKLCFHLISGVAAANRPVDDAAEYRVAAAAADTTIATGTVPIPYDGDLKSEGRLATLL